MNEADYFCDTCGEPATLFARDVTQLVPLPGTGSAEYIENVAVSDVLKCGCDEHSVESVETESDEFKAWLAAYESEAVS